MITVPCGYTTGKFILQEKIRTKMLTVPAPLRMASSCTRN